MARKKDEAPAEPAAQQQPARRKRKKSDREGLSGMLLHMQPETHRLITACVTTAAILDGGERSVARWCVAVLEAAALEYMREKSPVVAEEYERKRLLWSDDELPAG